MHLTLFLPPLPPPPSPLPSPPPPPPPPLRMFDKWPKLTAAVDAFKRHEVIPLLLLLLLLLLLMVLQLFAKHGQPM